MAAIERFCGVNRLNSCLSNDESERNSMFLYLCVGSKSMLKNYPLG